MTTEPNLTLIQYITHGTHITQKCPKCVLSHHLSCFASQRRQARKKINNNNNLIGNIVPRVLFFHFLIWLQNDFLCITKMKTSTSNSQGISSVFYILTRRHTPERCSRIKNPPVVVSLVWVQRALYHSSCVR